MRRYVLSVILLLLGLKYGIDFLLSEDFQKYGDKKKAQWTCHVNNFLGGIYEISSEYRQSVGLYDRVLNRCPDTPMAERAMFFKAYCLENLNQPREAMDAYIQYRDTFPNGQRINKVTTAIDRIRFSK